MLFTCFVLNVYWKSLRISINSSCCFYCFVRDEILFIPKFESVNVLLKLIVRDDLWSQQMFTFVCIKVCVIYIYIHIYIYIYIYMCACVSVCVCVCVFFVCAYISILSRTSMYTLTRTHKFNNVVHIHKQIGLILISLFHCRHDDPSLNLVWDNTIGKGKNPTVLS